MIDKKITFLEGYITKISMMALMLMMLTVFSDVAGRFLFNNPIPGAKEAIEFMMIFVVYFGLSYTQSQNGHVGMDLVVDKLKNKGCNLKKILASINSIIAISVTVLLIIVSFGHTLNVYKRGVLSIYLQWPMWFMSFCMLMGVTLLLLRTTHDFFNAIKGHEEKEL